MCNRTSEATALWCYTSLLIIIIIIIIIIIMCIAEMLHNTIAQRQFC